MKDLRKLINEGFAQIDITYSKWYNFDVYCVFFVSIINRKIINIMLDLIRRCAPNFIVL